MTKDGQLERRDGYVAMYVADQNCWVMAPDDTQPPPPTIYAMTDDTSLPDFMFPEVIAKLTPEINWDQRVGDRIRHFLEWGRV